MRAGDIIFVRGNSWISKAILWIDPGEFSHVAVAISDKTILEAQYNTRVRETKVYFDDYVVVDLGLTDSERILLAAFARKEIGKWYDFGTILWILFKRFFRFQGKNRFNSPNNYICTELINYLLVRLNKIPPHIDLKDSTPNQLYSYLTYEFPQKTNEME